VLVWTCFFLVPSIISMLLLLGFVCLVTREFLKIIFQILLYLFVNRKIDQWKILFSQKKLTWFPKKCFSFILGGKHFSEVMKNLEISYYLLIIINLILKLLIAIYFVLNLFFLISPLRVWFNLIFILTLVLILWLLFFFLLLLFLIEIFYLPNLVLILLIVTYFIWNNLWNYYYYYFNFIIFQFFYLLDLISIILIVIYFIWDNLWN